MRPVHYITIGAAVSLLIIIFLFGNTVPPKGAGGGMQQRGAVGNAQQPESPKPASLDSIVAKYKAALPATVSDSVNAIEHDLAAVSDNTQMAVVLKRLSGIWMRHKDSALSYYYESKIAKLESSEKKLTFAGTSFLQLMESEALPSIQLWEAAQAADCLELALKMDTANEGIKLNLATVYMEGTGEPMKGVQLLLGIVNDKPNDIPANLLLGRMSIRSGQIDKAINRLQTVLNQEPENTEALYFMAQAYKEKGDKVKAIELFEKCKRLVNKPEFTIEINQYINSFK